MHHYVLIYAFKNRIIIVSIHKYIILIFCHVCVTLFCKLYGLTFHKNAIATLSFMSWIEYLA